MPRVRTSESNDEIVVKKPRKPRTRVSVAEAESVTPTEPRKRAPRKTASRAHIEALPVATLAAVAAPLRKAPTPLAAERRRSVRSNRVLFVIVAICTLIVGSGVVVGMFDHGVIDVVAVVNERNEKISRGEVRDASGQTITMTVPVQTDTRPNGGLQIADPAALPAPMPEVTPLPVATATSTASSTHTTTASTSDAGTASSTPVTSDPALKPAS